jgi:hypothetical protein
MVCRPKVLAFGNYSCKYVGKWTGYDSIIYLAAIIGFDKFLYEGRRQLNGDFQIPADNQSDGPHAYAVITIH